MGYGSRSRSSRVMVSAKVAVPPVLPGPVGVFWARTISRRKAGGVRGTSASAPRRGGRMDTAGKRLRLLFPDLHGLERGKYLFGDWAATGSAGFCVGVYPLTHDKEILAVPRTQFDVGLHDVEAVLDRGSLRAGWEDDTLVGIADVEAHGR